MATVTKVPAKPVAPTYTIELSEEEAGWLLDVCRYIGSDTPERRLFSDRQDSLWTQLNNLGVRPSNTARGSIYFS